VGKVSKEVDPVRFRAFADWRKYWKGEGEATGPSSEGFSHFGSAIIRLLGGREKLSGAIFHEKSTCLFWPRRVSRGVASARLKSGVTSPTRNKWRDGTDRIAFLLEVFSTPWANHTPRLLYRNWPDWGPCERGLEREASSVLKG